jgi:hypothetical protein
MDADLVRDVKRALSNPAAVVERLGLKAKQKSRGYVLVCCPMHGERNASCSVHTREGNVAIRCHGCGWTGDVLTLVAAVNQLDTRADFPEVMAIACELAGLREQAEALRNGRAAPERAAPPPAWEPEPEPDYPPPESVVELWDTARSVADDPEASGVLVARRIDPDDVARLDAARVLEPETHHTRIPRWARFKGPLPVSRDWTKTGHRMLVRAWDSDGQLRSLRAWRVNRDERLPKRVPPAGHRTSALVLANDVAVAMLRGTAFPGRVVVVEGEPDWLVRSVLNPDEAVIGILSGSWTEHFAARVPYGAEVIVRTHLDPAGERYARAVIGSLLDRAVCRRLAPEPATEAA